MPAPFRSSLLALLILLLAGCLPDTDPVGLDSEEKIASRSASSSQVTADGNLMETIDFSVEFERGRSGPLSLAQEVEANGENYRLHVAQTHDADSGELYLDIRVENRGDQTVWRPLRVTATDSRPRSLILSGDLDSDDGPALDYGQSLGFAGRLESGEVSESRRLTLRMPDESPLSSFSAVGLTLGVSAALEVGEIQPTVLREPTAKEADLGRMLGQLMIQYAAGELQPDEVVSQNLELGLLAQEFEPVSGFYIAFFEETSVWSAEDQIERVKGSSRVVEATPVTLLSMGGSVLIERGGIPNSLDYGLSLDNHIMQGDYRHLYTRAEEAWSLDAAATPSRLPGEGTVVAVIDTGIDTLALNLSGAIEGAVDVRFGYTGKDNDPQDIHGHGTEVAGVISAQGRNGGPLGLAYGAKIYSIKVTDSKQVKNYNLGRGLKESLDAGHVLVNVSMSGGERIRDRTSANLYLRAPARRIQESGGLIITSVKNCFVRVTNNAFHNMEYTISVAGLDETEVDDLPFKGFQTTETSYCAGAHEGTSYGPHIALSAGFHVWTTTIGGGAVLKGGTSFSAPQVAAVAAILKARNPSLSGDAWREELFRHTVPTTGESPEECLLNGVDECVGRGRIVAHLGDDPPGDEVVSFGDATVEFSVRDALGLSDRPVTRADMAELTDLRVDGPVSTLSGLEWGENLQLLSVFGFRLGERGTLADLSPLSGLARLRNLQVTSQSISDVQEIIDLPSLTSLNVSDNFIEDVSYIAKISELRSLNLVRNNVRDASPLAVLTGFTNLRVSHNPLDVNTLSGLTGLTRLEARSIGFSNLDFVAEMTNLETLEVLFNNLTNIAGLEFLPNLRRLWLQFNGITDIAPLVANAGLGTGVEITIFENPLSRDAVCEQVPELRSRGVDLVHSSNHNCEDEPPPGPEAPSVSTRSGNSITTSTFRARAFVTPNNAPTNAWFEYSTNSTLSSGVQQTQPVYVGDGEATYSHNETITGLQPNTTYYFRALASNSEGESIGAIQVITTEFGEPLPDLEMEVVDILSVEGREMTVRVRAKNSGDGMLDQGWYKGFYLDLSGEWGDQTPLLVHEQLFSTTLRPGDSVEEIIRFDLPSVITSGQTWYLFVWADNREWIEEEQTDNNLMRADEPFTVP